MKPLLFALGTLALVGCNGLGVHPVGVLAKETPLTQQGKPLPAAPADPGAAGPAVRAAPNRPSMPTNTVTSDSVDPNHPDVAAIKLSLEVEADSKSIVNLPATAEISRIKDGVKQP